MNAQLKQAMASLERSPFSMMVGLKIAAAEKGEAIVRMPFSEKLLNDGGINMPIHGGAIASLEADRLIAAVAASATIGRWAILPAMWALPPVADRESLSRDIGRQIGANRLALGTAMAVPGCVWLALLSPWRVAIAIAAVLVLTAWLVRYVGRRLGGMNGDSLGFLCYASQVVVLLAAGASWPWLAEGAR